jgi:4-hydroxy-tetrahydrodipicolinate reductase
MKLILVGYGKMGKAIDAIAHAEGCTVVATADSKTPLTPALLSKGDAVIDFTSRDAFLKNVPALIGSGKPVVVGTTGWNDDSESVKAQVISSGSAMIHSANFSLGVQLFFRMARAAASLIAPFNGFDIAISETHHTQKLDSPSGTALKLASEVLSACPRKTKLTTSLDDRLASNQLLVQAIRLGKVFGTHTLHIDSEFDEIELRHNAKNRLGFAQGSIAAAKWLADKKGFFTIDDLLDDKLK